MKAKLDSAQVKLFLLNHVEKIVFGGFVVAFLLICWSAFKLKPYDKTPDQLKKIADDVSQQVEAKTPPEKFEDLPSVPNFTNLGAVGPAQVDPRFYVVSAMNLPYEEKQEVRKEPKFFALLDLKSYCGYGGIAIGESGQLARSANFGSGGDMMPGMDPMGGGYMPPPDAMMPGAMGGYQPPGYDPMASGAMAGGAMAGGAMGGYQPPGQDPMMGGAMPGYGPQRRKTAKERRMERDAARKAEAAAKAAARRARPRPVSTEKIVLTQAPAGSHVEGRYWVCLVGAIPYWKQLNEYQSTFRDARGFDMQRDYPRYVLPRIERAEVNGKKLGDWEELDVEEAVEDFEKWAAEYPEVVDKQFILPSLTEPLPPLIFANHDKEKVTHPLTKVVEQKPVVVEEESEAEKARKRRIRGFGGGGNAGRANTQSPMSYGGGGYAYGGMQGPGGANAPLVEHRLFRFFDFKAEPGKTYRYRVKLVLKNPNGGVPPRFLESHDLAKGESREAEWSEPSPAVTVIAGNRLLAGTVSPGRGEPTGHVLAKLFDADLAAEIRRLFDISRGSVLNELEAKVGLSEAENSPPKAAMLDFETDAVVLDMFGGDKIPGARNKDPRAEQPKIPGHFLVLDNDGDLRTLVQSTDAGMFETEAEEAERQRAPPEGPDNQRPGAAPGAPGGGFLDFNNIPETPKRRR